MEKTLIEFRLLAELPLYCWLKGEAMQQVQDLRSLNPEVTDSTDRSKVGGDCNPDDPNPLELGKPSLKLFTLAVIVIAKLRQTL